MITIFNRISVYTGFDNMEFNRIREALELNKIKYTYNVKNQMGEWIGRGTLRGNIGSAGQPSNLSYEYEIYIDKKEIDRAKNAVKKRN